jgi:hypothetical protein
MLHSVFPDGPLLCIYKFIWGNFNQKIQIRPTTNHQLLLLPFLAKPRGGVIMHAHIARVMGFANFSALLATVHACPCDKINPHLSLPK